MVFGLKNLKVMLMRAHSNIVNTILVALFTAQSNLITSSSIRSLWPNLICKHDTMRTDLPFLCGIRHPSSSLFIQFNNGYWKEDCGKYCLAKD